MRVGTRFDAGERRDVQLDSRLGTEGGFFISA